MQQIEPLNKLCENVSLQALNTLGVQSCAEFFAEVESLAELTQAIELAREHNWDINVIGGGSNVLLGETLPGLTIKPALKGVACEREGDNYLLEVGAGESWHEVVLHAHAKGVFGLENLALIPGTAGAAPIQNIGAYGVELKDVFHSLLALNIDSLETEVFTVERCQFAYRESFFKTAAGSRYIILQVTLVLPVAAVPNVTYPALSQCLGGKGETDVSAADVLEAVIRVRSEKLPDPAQVPNVGSFFKNPIISTEACNALRKLEPDLAYFDLPDSRVKKLAAAWLIDRAGWKGRCWKRVGVHPKQALVLINPEQRPAAEVLELAQEIAASVKERFGVGLEIEPRQLGEFSVD